MVLKDNSTNLIDSKEGNPKNKVKISGNPVINEEKKKKAGHHIWPHKGGSVQHFTPTGKFKGM